MRVPGSKGRDFSPVAIANCARSARGTKMAAFTRKYGTGVPVPYVFRCRAVDKLLKCQTFGGASARWRLPSCYTIGPPYGQLLRNRWNIGCTLLKMESDFIVVFMVNIRSPQYLMQKKHRSENAFLRCPWRR